MKKANDFQIAKIQPQAVAYLLLDFCLALHIKVLLIEKKRVRANKVACADLFLGAIMHI